MMKLLTGDLSPYSAKVRMQIYAMGIEDDIEFGLPVEFVMGKMNEVSPIGRIPVLELDDRLIPESEVIAEFLDEKYPDKAMGGSSAEERAETRVLARIADTYLMNNLFMSLSYLRTENPSEAVPAFLVGQVKRGLGALEQHIGEGPFAVGDTLTRADCALVPALWMCSNTMPMLGATNPIREGSKIESYWTGIQQNEHAARILVEMNRGMQARLDGTEKKLAEKMIAEAKAAKDQ